MVIRFNTTRNNKFLIIFILFLTSISSFNLAEGYSVGEQLEPAKSIFNQNPLQFSPIDLTKFIKSDDRAGLTFSDLLNAESFSSKDIGASAKAVLVLFIKLIVTTLNVSLGVFRVLLDILTIQWK